ncbi:hypothetical protein NDU88_006212 [Pleurodeles waltl]|uniref:Uncharacterized protein n=1 Tax=Pleurodeles waltl TaxID=8319 RepID=A0AAV7WDB4_PLEWA|nr:hypothetical protein NDU88_006212 [Pleurodeles waltl]
MAQRATELHACSAGVRALGVLTGVGASSRQVGLFFPAATGGGAALGATVASGIPGAMLVARYRLFRGKADEPVTDPEAEDAQSELGSSANPTQDPDIRSMFLELKHSLTMIDMKDKVDKHDERIDQLERRASDI